MRITKRLAIISTTALMLILISVMAVYAFTGSPSEPVQFVSAADKDIEAPASQTEKLAQQTYDSVITGLTDEQIDWVFYAIQNGRLPDLTGEQIAELRTAVMGIFEQGFDGILGGLSEEQMAEILAEIEKFIPGAFDGALAQIQAQLGTYLIRLLLEGTITQEQYDILLSVLQTGRLDLTDDQIEMLKAQITDRVNDILESGVIPQEHIDAALAMIEDIKTNGMPEFTDEHKEALQSKINEFCEQALADDRMPPELRVIIRSLMEGNIPEFTDEQKQAAKDKLDELKDKLIELPDQVLIDERIPQELRDIISNTMRHGLPEITDEQIEAAKAAAHAIPDRLLSEGIVTQEQLDELFKTLESLKSKLDSIDR